MLAYNPAHDAALNRQLVEKHAANKSDEDVFFTVEEIQIFLDHARNHELYELFYFAVLFGLRREEVLGIRWQSIDFKRRILTIEHTVTEGTKINHLNMTKTKSSYRQYPLEDEQIEMLKEMKRREQKNRKLFGRQYIEDYAEYVFNKKADGTLYYIGYPTKAFKKLLKELPELPQDVAFKNLRTSCISLLVHLNWDVKSVQAWVGHSDPMVTLRIYTKIKNASKKEVAAGLSKLIKVQKKVP